MVLKMNVDVDGQYGPYLMCNPNNVTNPHGAWYCDWDIREKPVPNWPKQCSAKYYSGRSNYCYAEPDHKYENKSLA